MVQYINFLLGNFRSLLVYQFELQAVRLPLSLHTHTPPHPSQCNHNRRKPKLA